MHEYTLSKLSDEALLRDLAALVARDLLTTARILAYIAEVDARRLYAPAGYPSMHAFCVEELRLSEDAAFKRIQAARAARRFPALFVAVAEGRLHLAAVCLLAPHLTVENAEGLIDAATHRPKFEIEAMLARRFPISGRPAPLRVLRAIPGPLLQETTSAPASAGDIQLAPGQVDVTAAAPPTERYLLQLTIGNATHEKLLYAQALLSHVLPPGDVAGVLDRALDALIGQIEKRRFGAGARVERKRTGRGSRPRALGAGKRYIPARVRRAVWERDGGRCTFVSARGHRCQAQRYLEFDHVVPVARGGTSTVEGLRLRCRAHNQYEADRVFGAGFMGRKRREARLALAETRQRSALAEAPAAPTRARAGTLEEREKHEELADLVAGLRSLGCRGELARRAVEFSQNLPGVTLEERLRAALQFIGRVAIHGGAP